jgi:hypothetical protein
MKGMRMSDTKKTQTRCDIGTTARARAAQDAMRPLQARS